jgi:hypothetical protein
MELIQPWESTNFEATQEILNISWNPEVYFRVRKCPPLVAILSEITSINTIPINLSKIHLNIIHPPTSKSF